MRDHVRGRGFGERRWQSLVRVISRIKRFRIRDLLGSGALGGALVVISETLPFRVASWWIDKLAGKFPK